MRSQNAHLRVMCWYPSPALDATWVGQPNTPDVTDPADGLAAVPEEFTEEFTEDFTGKRSEDPPAPTRRAPEQAHRQRRAFSGALQRALIQRALIQRA
jgi:hypothetical protein